MNWLDPSRLPEERHATPAQKEKVALSTSCSASTFGEAHDLLENFWIQHLA